MKENNGECEPETNERVAFQASGNVERPANDEYTVACVVCQEKKPVLLYPHRLNGNVIGWVFVCADHQKRIQGADVRIQLIETYNGPQGGE